jgi:ionotropic glutamate receptor
MLVLAKNDDKATMWIFLEPLTKELWIATMVFIFFTGLVVWMIEHPTNDEFKGSRWKQFSTAFYFTFSTLTFSHGILVLHSTLNCICLCSILNSKFYFFCFMLEFLIIHFFIYFLTDQILKKLHSKVVVVIWCFVVLVLVQSYTASLSSLLTAKRLQPSVTDPMQLLRNGDYVGYQSGSFVYATLKRLKFDAQKIKVLSTLEEYAKALRTGSKHGGVSAIFDEIPYLNSFLTQYGKEFQIVGPIDRTDGFGFVSSLQLCHRPYNLHVMLT